MTRGMKHQLLGMTFGKLVVLEKAGRDKNNNQRFLCKCECGKEKIILGASLVKKHQPTRSCGCISATIGKEYLTTHGLTQTKTYRCWGAMKSRCQNKNHNGYPHYGAKGITVCSKWQTFEGFLEDMGECPEGYFIDRIDFNRNYEKENCRWVDKTVSARNRSGVKLDMDKANEIRVLFNTTKLSNPELGTMFNVSRRLINNLRHNQIWL